MHYRFAQDRPDYSDLSSGRVFYSLSGHPAFPIRLASEIFQRCLAVRRSDNLEAPCTLYDPCCGSGYQLAVLAYLHWDSIGAVFGSDVDSRALEVAARNLALLAPDGMDRRIAEIAGMLARFGKESHAAALASARVLRERIAALTDGHALQTRTFQANALDRRSIPDHLPPGAVDIVLTDVPYGLHSRWIDPHPDPAAQSPLGSMLDTLLGILSPTGVVAVVFDKGQKAAHEGYRRIEQFQAGKRRVAILKPAG
jgi:hypothetical protein